ncbi:MAG TPA: hypothetical protein DEB06_03875, partial [Phycisphaerales bacterium]|nr:hypothetical protein [Phycisphaerales bacterium]
MRTNTARSLLVRTLSASMLVALAGAATLARQPATDDPLSGPKVEDKSPPGVNPTLDGGMRDRRSGGAGGSGGGERNRPMVFVRAVMSLAGENTPEDARLTDEQRDQVRAIAEEYAGALREFRAAHQDEIDALRPQGGPPAPPPRGGGGGG